MGFLSEIIPILTWSRRVHVAVEVVHLQAADEAGVGQPQWGGGGGGDGGPAVEAEKEEMKNLALTDCMKQHHGRKRSISLDN